MKKNATFPFPFAARQDYLCPTPKGVRDASQTVKIVKTTRIVPCQFQVPNEPWLNTKASKLPLCHRISPHSTSLWAMNWASDGTIPHRSSTPWHLVGCYSSPKCIRRPTCSTSHTRATYPDRKGKRNKQGGARRTPQLFMGHILNYLYTSVVAISTSLTIPILSGCREMYTAPGWGPTDHCNHHP